MNKEEKKQIDKEVLDIISFHLKILRMKENKENMKLATAMFVEGSKYIKERKKK